MSLSVTAAEERELLRLRWMAKVMDEWIEIPFVRFRIGLDGLLGLLPVAGDLPGLFVSLYLLLAAARLNVPKVVLVRMFVNIAIDSVVGAIPLAGDLFDFVWKANKMNIALLERHIAEPRKAKRSSLGFLLLLALVLALVIAGAIAISFWVATLIRSATGH